MMNPYPDEVLDEYNEDDGTMVESKEALAEAIIGHKIVTVEDGGTVLVLDNGKRVELVGRSDCCAYTDVEAFLLHPDKVDHAILGVGTTDQYQTWHIYADWGDILELTVGWSCGNPFYYGYGFEIRVRDEVES